MAGTSTNGARMTKCCTSYLRCGAGNDALLVSAVLIVWHGGNVLFVISNYVKVSMVHHAF